jgi:hypothetical protein
MSRALSLACDRALSGLTPEQEMELVSLLPPGKHIDPGLELAAAAITLSELSIDEPLPRHLADRILAASADQRASVVPRGGTMPIAVPQTGARTMVLPSTSPPASELRPTPRDRAVERGLDRDGATEAEHRPVVAPPRCFGLAVGSVAYFTTREGKTPPVESNSPAETKLSAGRAGEAAGRSEGRRAHHLGRNR